MNIFRNGGSIIKKDSHRKHYTYFCNKECEYFPCHPDADTENFNCLFCYCPLYVLGKDCGGKFTYLPNGCKDCSRCLYPHQVENYDAITAKHHEILAVMEQKIRHEGAGL